MKDVIVDEVVEALKPKLPMETLTVVKNVLIHEMDNYNVSAKTTEVSTHVFALPDEVKMFLMSKQISGLSKCTLSNYLTYLTSFFQHVQKPIFLVETNDVRKYFIMLQQTRQLGNKTLNTYRLAINSFFSWCIQERILSRHPMTNILPIRYAKNNNPDTLSETELEYLRNACTNIRDKALVEFFFSSGCRLSEVANLTIDKVDFEDSSVVINGKGNKIRKVYISNKAKLLLKMYLDSRTDDNPSVFITLRKPYRTLTAHTIEHTFHVLGKKAGINRNVYPHLIRHTTATLGLERGMNVTSIQRILGHSNVNTTMIYAGVSDNTVKDEYMKCM